MADRILIRRYSDRGAEMNYSQRFRFGNLLRTTSSPRVLHKRMRSAKKAKWSGISGRARKIEASAPRAKAKSTAPVAVALRRPGARTEESPRSSTPRFAKPCKRRGIHRRALSRDQFQQFLKKKDRRTAQAKERA